MSAPSPVRLSASAVEDYRTCPYRYARTYASPLPDRERATVTVLTFGAVVHEVLADFVRQGGWERLGKTDLFALLRARWPGNIYQDDDLSMANFERAADMLEKFFDRPYPSQVVQELGVERRVGWLRYRRGIMATGRIDRACLVAGNVLELIDYKTGSLRLEADRLLAEPQALFLRSLGAEAFRELEPSATRVTFLYLASAVPVSVEYEQEEFLLGWARIEAIAERIRQAMASVVAGTPVYEAFPLNRGERCRLCPMRLHCDALIASGAVPEEGRTA